MERVRPNVLRPHVNPARGEALEEPLAGERAADGGGTTVVQFFHTCLVNELAPHVGFAAARVLEHVGCQVHVPPDQTCCGQPAFNAGFDAQARAAAQHTIALLEAISGTIVIPSGSCADMLVHQYPRLFAGSPAWQARAVAVARRCREFSAFVAERSTGSWPKRVEARVVYHPSCHLARGLGIDRAPRALVSSVDGVEVRNAVPDDECCGFGGLFSVKHGDISARMLERKLQHLSASGADRVVSCDMGCLLQIGGGLHRRGWPMQTQHLAELLAEAIE